MVMQEQEIFLEGMLCLVRGGHSNLNVCYGSAIKGIVYGVPASILRR